MKNSKQTFKKGYGNFPYIIDRVSSGVYKQIPIEFTAFDSEECELGVSLAIKMEHSVISREDLILIHKDSLVNLTKRLKENLENLEMVGKRMCLVLGPKKGIYFESNNEIIESNSIPRGGWLLGKNNERVTESEYHYRNNQSSNFNVIDCDLLSFDIDEEKLTQIAKEDTYRTFLFEKMWSPKRKNGINWMRKMLDNSESDN